MNSDLANYITEVISSTEEKLNTILSEDEILETTSHILSLLENKSCGGKGKKYRKLMGIKECFCSELDPMNVINALNFKSSKPFKVSFNEGIEVSWKNNLISEEKADKKEGKPKKLTPRDKKQKEEFLNKLKTSEFKKRYGERAKGVMHAVATKEAKKKP